MKSPKHSEHFNLLCDVSELTSLLSSSDNIEHFLQHTVVMIAQHLNADVCSIYLFEKESHELVLKATVGLNPDAVGKVRMKINEGLVGLTLEQLKPVCEGNACQSPRFKYFIETREDPFNSFLSVPIFSGAGKIGVLVVQHRKHDYFDRIDVMALQAIASQLAGAIGNAHLMISLHNQADKSSFVDAPPKMRFIKAESASAGYAFAPAAVIKKSHGRYLKFAEDIHGYYGLADFRRALEATTKQLERLQARFAKRLPESVSLIFTAHFMMLKDERLIKEITTLIEQGTPVVLSIQRVAQKYISIFTDSSDVYMREKANDMEDLAGRIIENLIHSQQLPSGADNNHIAIARNLYPSEVLHLAATDVKGLVLVGGGLTSHVVILARSMQIPTIISDAIELLHIPDGTPILLDADIGNIYLHPTEDIVEQFESRQIRSVNHAARPITRTRDGAKIKMLANINLLSELPHAQQVAAEGIGLYRTEFPFLIRSTFPSEEEQYLVYRRLFSGMTGKLITIRTLDIGGDKLPAYANVAHEANPALGLRSIRFTLKHREIFEQQLRAVLRAATGTSQLRIMFPMISSVDEFLEAKAAVLDCVRQLQCLELDHHRSPSIGMMVEVPSTVEIIAELALEADFFSIGTNDFIQYLLAVDRNSRDMAAHFQPFHPSVLRAFKKIVDAARAHRKDVTICGEVAHLPGLIAFLLGIGVRSFSASPHMLPQLQTLILEQNTVSAKNLAAKLLQQTTIQAVENIIQDYFRLDIDPKGGFHYDPKSAGAHR